MVKSETEEFCDWASTRNVGCYFARAMFKAPSEYGIKIEHIRGGSGRELAAAVDAATQAAIHDPAVEAKAFVFERTLPLAEYAAVLRGLIGRNNWHLREEYIAHDGIEYAIIGVDVSVGMEDGVPALSELVGFGPYSYLPITRRAPVLAIVLRTKAAFSLDPLPSRSERRANLAAIRLQIDTNAFNALWEKSKELRAELDGTNNPIARARVALAIPANVWASTDEGSALRTSNA
jgi:hypothetical protein